MNICSLLGVVLNVSVGDLFRATQNFTTLHNSVPPFDVMIFSVTTVAAREQKHHSFLPEEQIALKFSGNDVVMLNYRLTVSALF